MPSTWADSWGTSWGSSWDISTTPAPAVDTGGHSGYDFGQPKRKKSLTQKAQEEIRKDLLNQLFGEKKELDQAPEEVRKQVKKIVRPYYNINRSTLDGIDLEILRLDILRLQYLIDAVNKEKAIRDKQDEEELLMLLDSDLL